MEVIALSVTSADRRLAGQPGDLGETVRTGVLWGVIGAAVMAMYAMAAGLTYLGSGFFTPLYHIASTVIEPQPMVTSMQNAMEGQTSFYFAPGPAAVGMMVHLAVGAAFGVVFAVLARKLKLVGVPAVGVGAVYGVLVLLFSSFIGLSVAASLFDAGDPIADMPQMVGWTTFTIEHVMFGMVLGIGWFAATRAVRGKAAHR